LPEAFDIVNQEIRVNQEPRMNHEIRRGDADRRPCLCCFAGQRPTPREPAPERLSCWKEKTLPQVSQSVAQVSHKRKIKQPLDATCTFRKCRLSQVSQTKAL